MLTVLLVHVGLAQARPKYYNHLSNCSVRCAIWSRSPETTSVVSHNRVFHNQNSGQAYDPQPLQLSLCSIVHLTRVLLDHIPHAKFRGD